MNRNNSGFLFPELSGGEGLDLETIFGSMSGASNDVNPFEAALAQQATPIPQAQEQTQPAPQAQVQTAESTQPAPQAVQQPTFQSVQPVQAAPVSAPAAAPAASAVQPPSNIDPLTAAIAEQEAKTEQKAAKSLFEKAPVFPTKAHIDADLSQDDLPEDRYLHYIDIHSHNSMAAKFFSVDDDDEQATRICIVVGRLDKFFPDITVRMSCGRTYLELDPGCVLESLGVVFPQEWRKKVKLIRRDAPPALRPMALTPMAGFWGKQK